LVVHSHPGETDQILVAGFDSSTGVSELLPLGAPSVIFVPLRALCGGHGFREVGVYEKHARLDGSWRDGLIMERLLPENLR
jgi:hypothetical protein